MNNSRDYAQGARCGHIDGKARTGQYVIGEEIAPSWEASENQAIYLGVRETHPRIDDWAKGYRYGYRRGAEGSALPGGLVNAPLPERAAS
jgi:hypothetical protein